jgi:hypothetical protein
MRVNIQVYATLESRDLVPEAYVIILKYYDVTLPSSIEHSAGHLDLIKPSSQMDDLQELRFFKTSFPVFASSIETEPMNLSKFSFISKYAFEPKINGLDSLYSTQA